MRFIKLTSLCMLFLLLFSCTKENVVLDNPALCLVVRRIDDKSIVSNGVVLLYSSYEEWFNNGKPIMTAITNENGEATFYNLEEKDYYFGIYCKNYGNYPKGIYRLGFPLEKGYISNINIYLYESNSDMKN